MSCSRVPLLSHPPRHALPLLGSHTLQSSMCPSFTRGASVIRVLLTLDPPSVGRNLRVPLLALSSVAFFHTPPSEAAESRSSSCSHVMRPSLGSSQSLIYSRVASRSHLLLSRQSRLLTSQQIRRPPKDSFCFARAANIGQLE